MKYSSLSTIYFHCSGKSNTTETLKLAIAQARKRKIKHLVVASTSGTTALRLAQLCKNELSIICVTHQCGFARAGHCELHPAVEKKLKTHNVKILKTTHLFAGIDRAIRLKFGGLAPAEIVANTYRTLGEGVKVAVEIAIMALDAELVPYGRDIISIAGTGVGADTAIIIRPAHSHHFFATRIKEIICKPVKF